jgi:hypothetical protein
MVWKLKTKYGNAIHLYTLGADKTLCGRPQEDYDTEEGLYTLYQFLKHNRNCCLKCIQAARRCELLGGDSSITQST